MSLDLVERRGEPRYIVLFHATGLLQSGGTSLPCQLVDISNRGARVSVTLPTNHLASKQVEIPGAQVRSVVDLRGSFLPSGHLMLPLTCERIVYRSTFHIDIAGTFYHPTPVPEALLDEWVRHGQAVVFMVNRDVVRLKGRPAAQALWRLDRYMVHPEHQRIELDPECPPQLAFDLQQHFRNRIRVDVAKHSVFRDIVQQLA